MSILMISPDFDRNGPMPRKHTGEGRDLSPSLSWSSIPPGTAELALICDDPDAPSPKPWVHWVLYGIAPSVAALAPGADGGGKAGRNDFGNAGYGGPMPPRGHGVHHYHFKLYALDKALQLRAGASKDELVAAMQGHILDQGELIGTYERR
jgi:Raf kinase inhibitor-like YbhB/YbcL family protein